MNTCGQPRCGRVSYPAPNTCAKESWPADHFALAMAYVPMQKLKSICELDEALQQGMIFPEVNKPLMGVIGGGPC